MTRQEDYSQRVADLIGDAFQNLGNAMSKVTPEERSGYATTADLQIKAAQAIATLATAREARVQALLQLAALDSVGGDAPDQLIAREAYAQAALMLGLVEDPDELTTEQLRDLLTGGDDPADADLGDLK